MTYKNKSGTQYFGYYSKKFFMYMDGSSVILLYKSGPHTEIPCGVHINKVISKRLWLRARFICGKLSRGNLRKVKCGMFHKLPVITFTYSTAKKFHISADRKLPFARVVQQMCDRCIAASGVPRSLPFIFFVDRLSKNGNCLQFLLTSKSLPHSKCHIGLSSDTEQRKNVP